LGGGAVVCSLGLLLLRLLLLVVGLLGDGVRWRRGLLWLHLRCRRRRSSSRLRRRAKGVAKGICDCVVNLSLRR
jgi:hypothetical protein